MPGLSPGDLFEEKRADPISKIEWMVYRPVHPAPMGSAAYAPKSIKDYVATFGEIASDAHWGLPSTSLQPIVDLAGRRYRMRQPII